MRVYPAAFDRQSATVATIQNVSCPMQWVRSMYFPFPENQLNRNVSASMIECIRSSVANQTRITEQSIVQTQRGDAGLSTAILLIATIFRPDFTKFAGLLST